MRRSHQIRPRVRRPRRTFQPELDQFEPRWYPGDILVPLAWRSVGAALLPLAERPELVPATTPASTPPALLHPTSTGAEPALAARVVAASAAPPGQDAPAHGTPLPAATTWRAWVVPDPFADPLADPWSQEPLPGRRSPRGLDGERADPPHGTGGDGTAPPSAGLPPRSGDAPPALPEARAAADLAALGASRPDGGGDPPPGSGGRDPGPGAGAATPGWLQRRYG